MTAEPDIDDEFIEEIAEQTDDLCHIHGHITRIIANLNPDTSHFEDYHYPNQSSFDLKPILLMFLYQHARDFNYSELSRRLCGAAYVYVSIGLDKPLHEETIRYSWKERFTLEERTRIKAAAKRIQEICNEHNIDGSHEPALLPQDLPNDNPLTEKQIRRAVEQASEHAFKEFSADRAHNTTFPIEAYLERQGYLNMANAGTTTPSRRFARLSNRSSVPSGSAHNRTLKKIADPERQTELWDYTTDHPPPFWERIRDEVLDAFHRGVENQLEEIAGRDRNGIREPVMAAIDITTQNFWPSPLKRSNAIEPTDEPVQIEHGDGTIEEIYPKEDYPEMVSGFKDSHERGYKFATITIVAQDTPIVLGIEPIRDYRWWEPNAREDVHTTPRDDVVSRLLEQAQQHVDIHKVFCDREFDVNAIRTHLDKQNVQYVIGKKKLGKADYENIEQIAADPIYDTRIEHATLTVDGHTHDVSFVYLPGDDSSDEEGYSIFTMNGHIDYDRAQALLKQYRHRWEIENQYKTIKKHFLPTTATKDYRNRFLYFVIAVIMYNVWRLTSFILRDEIDAHLGADPPILAGEIIELIGFCLFDPGD